MDNRLNTPSMIRPQRRGKSFKIVTRFKFILFLAALIIGMSFVWSFFSSTSSVFKFNFFSNPLKSTNNRVNVLMLGNAGGTHDGPYLTDSIIVASYDLKLKKVTLFSIPRDLWIDAAKAKVNALYEIGQAKDSNGLKFAEEKLSQIFGIPIHYGVRLDFSGFAKAIDLVGGVDIEVPKTFDDYNYPIAGKEDDLCSLQEKEIELSPEQAQVLNLPVGKQKVLVDSQDKVATQAADFACRFEHIQFTQGKMHMDGETGLKFVRSRMGNNGEGSDFARSRRQQLVLQAFREKVLSLQTLTNPSKIASLIDTFGKSFETDIETARFLDFYSLVKQQGEIDNVVFGDLGEGKSVFINPPPSEYGGAYVLIPPNGDFSSVKEFVKNRLK